MKDGVQHTYRLVDGVTYYQTKNQQAGFAQESTECLTASSLPPVKDMLEALNAAKPITKVESSESISCEGKLLSTSLDGSPFVICAASDASKGFKVYGSDFNVDMTYLSSKIEIPKPAMSAEQAEACAKTPAAAKLTTSTANLITGTTSGVVSEVMSTEAATVILPEATCTCAGAKRPCLFIHGLGHDSDGGLADSFDYFGDIASHAPCCSSIKFALLDTVNNAWYSDTSENKVCTHALSMSSSSSTSTKTVADTIIVTHSMGNLILGGAIASGKCSLASTTSWVGLSGPMIGSMGSDYLQSTCASGGLLAGIASLFGGCPANTATKSLAYEGEAYCPADLKTKYDAAQASYTSKVSAVMCSNAVDGLLSTDQAVLKLAAAVIPHKSSENDGVVEYQSCRAGLATSKFSNTYTSKFYVTKLNHLDTTFRHGDALIQTSQMPVKWFECLL
ncbi:hypothetical protein Poli38472_005148 [Pythium oligandrum]|uniref:Uncharacterized protein n=1 Tax=Pythium oligandrum TaxID=41045 RepID=A0A8K1CG18_PYTOL|nr:hypothetical protein Poli38472_005148 [Pythium oligandrum]|eukprot:TMW62530.1 hypothetical protein Poli38472_005148 [Pythium oligandrum]